MDPIILFVGLVLLLTIVGLVITLSQNSKGSNTSEPTTIKADFIPTQMYRGSDGLGGLAVNERTHQICLFKSASSRPELFPTADLIASYLIRNGEIVGETKRTFPSQVVTFSQQLESHKESLIESLQTDSSEDSHQRIDLLVLVYDPNDAILSINFLNMPANEGHILFEKSLSTATHWHNVLHGLILQADQLAGAPPKAPAENAEKEMAGMSS